MAETIHKRHWLITIAGIVGTAFVIVFFVGDFAKREGVKNNYDLFDPNSEVAVYDPENPPKLPEFGTAARWIRSKTIDFESSSFKSYFYKGVAFRLRFPEVSAKNSFEFTRYPLVIVMHGIGEGGTIYDNEKQLIHGAREFDEAIRNKQFNGFVLFPQANAAQMLFHREHVQIIGEFVERYLIPQAYIDPNRIVVQALSWGTAAATNFQHLFPKLIAGYIFTGGEVSYQENADIIDLFRAKMVGLYDGRWSSASESTTNRLFVEALERAGGSIVHTIYAWEGHRAWRTTWKDPLFFEMLNHVHMANPWPLFGQRKSCPAKYAPIRLEVTAGLSGYEWRKDSELIAGANANSLLVNEAGRYSCRIKRGDEWSIWSPQPAVIVKNCQDEEVSIEIEPFTSRAIPSPDGIEQRVLKVPAGFFSYEWRRDGIVQKNGTYHTFVADSPGTYDVLFRTKEGAPQHHSRSFRLINAQKGTVSAPFYDLGFQSKSLHALELQWNNSRIKSGPGNQIEIYRMRYREDKYTKVTPIALNASEYVDTIDNPRITWSYLIRVYRDDGQVLSIIPAIQKRGEQNILDFRSPQDLDPHGKHAELFRGPATHEQYRLIATIPASESHYLDEHISPGVKYSYLVRIITDDYVSEPVELLFATGLEDQIPPSIPSNLRYQYVYGNTLEVYWNHSTDNDTVPSYMIAKSENIELNQGLNYQVFSNLAPQRVEHVAVKARDTSRNESSFSKPIMIELIKNGVTYEYFRKPDLSLNQWSPLLPESAIARGLSDTISLNSRLVPSDYAAVWSGCLHIPETGEYVLKVQTNGYSAIVLSPSTPEVQLSPPSSLPSPGPVERFASFNEGSSVPFLIRYINIAESDQINFLWKRPSSSEFEVVPANVFRCNVK